MRTRLSLLALSLTLPGVTIIGQAAWTVDPVPVLDVRGLGADGKVIFGYPAGATRLANGSLLIADRAENGIRLVGANGKLVRTVGRAGDGPGEFRSMMWAGGCGADSMLVWDLSRNLATLIGPSGAVARQFAVPAGDTAQTPFQFSCGPTRTMAYLSVPRPVRGGPPPTDPRIVGVTAALYRVTAEGTVQQRFGDVPAGEMVALQSATGGRGGAPRPLGRSAAVAVVGNAVVIGSADSALATVVRGDGARSEIRIPVTRRAPTSAEFDAAVQSTVSMMPPRARQGIVEQLAAMPMPARLPAISALFGDPDGLLWVQASPAGAEVVEFVVMRLDGRVVARTQVPSRLTVFEVGRDYILGSFSDADDEIHVAVFHLRRE